MDTAKTETKRRRWTSKRRQRFLAKFHQSQLTQNEFAGQHGVGLSTLNRWLRLEREAVPAKVAFEEVQLPSPVKRWPIEVVSPQGWIVRLQSNTDVQQFGGELSRKTMGCWAGQTAELLKPVYRAIREDLLAGNYLQADETPIRYLDPDVKGKSQQDYLWVYSRPKSDVLFEWRVNRSRAGPEEFLKNFQGKLQTDGCSAYESLAKARGDLTLVGCWAHVRRGFHEAWAETKLAAWFVGQIGQLYAVEKKVREQKAGPALREAMRAWQSQPVLTRLNRTMELIRKKTLPQGLLGQAIDYTLKWWTALNQFIEDGTLEIDNNLIKNAIRPSALGKKNWMFIGLLKPESEAR
jgi:transposase-like protein